LGLSIATRILLRSPDPCPPLSVRRLTVFGINYG
jgi:hypothetical protein